MSSLEKIFSKKESNINLGLVRMHGAIERLRLRGSSKDILIGGTNGKGSTAFFLYQMLKNQGYEVCLYTSPHILLVEERFLYSAKQITLRDLEQSYMRLQQKLDEAVLDELSFFETLTLIAIEIFQDVPWRIFEVGLGGRLDATNALEPCLSIVTSIGYDHCDRLGHTLEAILGEKLGIARSGMPLIVPTFQQQSLNEMVDASKAKVFRCMPSSLLPTPYGQNLALAQHAYRLLTNSDYTKGLEMLKLPAGRAERRRLTNGTEIVLDVAHNLEALEALWEYLSCKIDLVLMCVLNDKPKDRMITFLEQNVAEIRLFRVEHERCTGISSPLFKEVWESIEIEKYRQVLVCGSFLAVEQAYKVLQLKPLS
jgi:dihydrofolate synthase / folylpolyglutamate synthase